MLGFSQAHTEGLYRTFAFPHAHHFEKRKNVCVAVRAYQRAAKNGRRSESMGGIGAAQSANQGIEQKTRTKRWSWTDRCLPAHRDYCEAAAWSVTEINDEVWGSMFSFLNLFHFLYFWPGRGKNGNRKDGCFPARTGVQSEDCGLADEHNHCLHLFSVGELFLPAHFDDCVRHFQD